MSDALAAARGVSDKEARFIAQKMLELLQELRRHRHGSPIVGTEPTGVRVDPAAEKFVHKRAR